MQAHVHVLSLLSELHWEIDNFGTSWTQRSMVMKNTVTGTQPIAAYFPGAGKYTRQEPYSFAPSEQGVPY